MFALNSKLFIVAKSVNGGNWLLYSQHRDRTGAEQALLYGKLLHADRCPKDSVEWRIDES